MSQLRNLAGLALLLPLAFGCARTAPFDQMDKAQITVLRLTAPAPSPLQPGGGLIPAIPGLPAEIGQLGQQAIQGLGGMIPQGMLPPGLIPGGAAPGQPSAQQFKGFTIAQQMPLSDEGMRDELLDVFGHESNFSAQRGSCFTPGLGIVMQRPNAPEVDLLVSFTCNQVMMDGARWPYQVNGLTGESRDHLAKIYERLGWGPVPQGG